MGKPSKERVTHYRKPYPDVVCFTYMEYTEIEVGQSFGVTIETHCCESMLTRGQWRELNKLIEDTWEEIDNE